MKKKLTALAIVFTMMLSLIVPMSALAVNIADDVAGTEYEEAAYLLGALGIMVGDEESGNFRPEDTLRRSEFAKIAVALAGLTEVAEGQTATRYPDVVKGHWATGFISVADSKGYVIGDDTGNFRPDDDITFAEAVTVLTRVLGYEPTALDNGGFPSGYLVTAAQNGLTRGISHAANEPIKRGSIADLAYNALSINLMKKVSYGSNEIYEVVDETLLEDVLGVYEEYGQITATNQSSLKGESTLKDDEVQITESDKGEASIFKTGGNVVRQYLGYNVVYYYTQPKANSDKTLILVRPNTAKMTEIKIDAENLSEIEGNGTEAKTLRYWINKETDKKTQKLSIAGDATVFYNGVATSANEYAVENIMDVLTTGYVTLVDIDKNDVYDLVFMTKYVNYVVDEVSLTGNKIMDKGTNPSLKLDPTDSNLTFSIVKNGVEIGLEDLEEYDVLSVAMSGKTPDESSVINIIVSNDKVEGVIAEVSDDKYTIGGNEYAASESLYSEFNLGLDDEGVFYLDAEGKIAWFEAKSTASDNYGFIVAADMSKNIDSRLEIKMFTKDSETVILNGADKIKFNDEGSFTGSEILAKIKASADDNFAGISEYAQLVVYDVNAAGYVSQIHTANDNSANQTELKDKFSMDAKGEALVYKATANKLDKFNLNNNTVVFDIPKSSTGTKTDEFAVRTSTMFTDKSSYDVTIYDLTAELVANAIVVMNSDGETDVKSPVALVDKITVTKNEDGDEVHKLYTIANGEKIEVITEDTTVLYNGENMVEQGDVIQYRVNSAGEIEKITVLFAAANANNQESFKTTVDERNDIELVYGIVNKKFSTSINVQNANGINNYATGNAKVYLFDASKTRNQVSLVDASEISKYDDADPSAVFIRVVENEVKEIVIVKLSDTVSF
ncbi:MAG: S-layer homology domain-containing protein [Eubacteriales bacterium]|nr:S-layer homology domain-containing protein [Eubacteriales bacterium]